MTAKKFRLDEDLDDTDTNKIFSTYGVNLAVIGYKTNSTKLTVKDWYNYVSLDDTTPQDVANFVNRYYLNSDYKNTLTNNWCKPGADPVYDDTGVLNTIQEPRDYNGPQTQMDQWKSTNGQSERYCNFQDTTYTYNRKQTTKLVKVTVFYELEVEKDFLKFFADGVEVESFTGIDVNSSNFIVDATVIQAKFTTDNSGVYRGFKAIFDEVDS
uniref:CUB domain-containing protein n=1 Tax=Caenorhabditis japonica TaxID=281687 RepID=A0A8R1EAA9_CAEJA